VCLYKYAARIFCDGNDALQEVVPGPVSGPGSAAYLASTRRNWLTPADATNLKQLLEAYERTPLVEPVQQAFWYYESAARIYEVDVRWTLVATGLEALIHTDRYKSTEQFVVRVPKLAEKVGTGVIEPEQAEKMWDFRCSLAHGRGLNEVSDETLQLYTTMENLLRESIRQAILNPDLAEFFGDREKVKSEWPIEQPGKKRKHRLCQAQT
jgi:hypothetical protein